MEFLSKIERIFLSDGSQILQSNQQILIPGHTFSSEEEPMRQLYTLPPAEHRSS